MLPISFTIARTTFLEALRQPIFFVLMLVCGLALVLTTWGTGYAMGGIDVGEVSGDNKELLGLTMGTVFLCGTLLAAFVATSAISREIENKTVLTVVSKPVPRYAIILGKYLGVTGAMMVAVVTMIMGLLLCIRHGVLSNASQDVDKPVVVMAMAAFALSMLVAAWTNFFYGWNFVQVSMLLLCPLMVLAYVLVLLISPDWKVQALATDFKPQIMLACSGLAMALAVMCAIAVAVSARLGQVMTIVTCFGVLVLGLLSNGLVGRYVFTNDPVTSIVTAEPVDEPSRDFKDVGDTYVLTLKSTSAKGFAAGDSVYYGPSPNGVDVLVPTFPRFTGNVSDVQSFSTPGAPSGVLCTAVEGDRITVRMIGHAPARVGREPRKGDYVFRGPTRTNAAALGVWGAIPNWQFFWLLDPVLQNEPIPASHVGLMGAYTLVQIGEFLALAVLLFQRREVG